MRKSDWYVEDKEAIEREWNAEYFMMQWVTTGQGAIDLIQ